MDNAKRSIIRSDRLGLINARLLGKGDRVDYTRVEGASVKIMSKLHSPEGKRLFLRLFVTVQLQLNLIGGVARAVLDASVIDPLVESIKVRIDELHKSLNASIDGAEILFKQHGIVTVASYDTPPLEVEVPILSAQSRRYYEAIVKFDQLMPLLQTLQIHEVITDTHANESRAQLKATFRGIAGTSRRMADRLRTRIFQESKDGDMTQTRAALGAIQQGHVKESSDSKEPPRLSANARKRRNRRIKREAAEKARLAAAADTRNPTIVEADGGLTSMLIESTTQDASEGDASAVLPIVETETPKHADLEELTAIEGTEVIH